MWVTTTPSYWIMLDVTVEQQQQICDVVYYAVPHPTQQRTVFRESASRLQASLHRNLSGLKIYGHQVYQTIHMSLLLEKLATECSND